MELAFRPMTADDLPLVTAWLSAAHVNPWWVPTDLDEILRAVNGDDPVEPWLLLLDGHPVGYFQVYDIGYDGLYRAACATVGVDAGTAGMDYLIGDAELVGRGVGTEAIGTFVRDIVFGRAPWPAVCAGPDPVNQASIRVLEKNGFEFAGVIDTADGPEHLMVRQRRNEA
jgi:aminoglycoside 6'-N-acetyltransferase